MRLSTQFDTGIARYLRRIKLKVLNRYLKISNFSIQTIHTLASEHADLFDRIDAQKTFNSSQDLNAGFRATLQGKDHSMCKAF